MELLLTYIIPIIFVAITGVLWIEMCQRSHRFRFHLPSLRPLESMADDSVTSARLADDSVTSTPISR